MGFVAVVAAGAGAAAAPPDTLAAGAGGATGLVAITWISGRVVAPEFWAGLGASWATIILGAMTTAILAAQANLRNAVLNPNVLTRPLSTPNMCELRPTIRANSAMVCAGVAGKILPNLTGKFWQSGATSRFLRCVGR